MAVGALSGQLTTCRSPGEQGQSPSTGAAPAAVQLDAVDTSELTEREKQDFSSAVSELLAPCADQPVSLAQCVQEKRDCKACLPAARFVARQVRKGAPRAKIEAAFRIRFAPEAVKSVSVDGYPSQGPKDAPVTLVEWADFECPFCRAAAPLLDSKVAAFPGKLRVVFRHYPLSKHLNADGAARAATAAGLQGKFWEMHHLLFANQDDLGKPVVLGLARKLGLDMKRFQDDVDSEAVADAVQKDRKEADALGLNGTPLIYINGRHFDLDYFDIQEDLDEWITTEIEARTGQKVSPVAVKLEAYEDGAPRGAKQAAEEPKPSASGAARPAASASAGR